MKIPRRKPKQPPSLEDEPSPFSRDSSATTTPSPVNHDHHDEFEARRSARTGRNTKADGDTWQETLAVCEVAGEITTRSYYTNQRTGERVWDEPPSGASTIKHATEEMRSMAQVQLQEMQIIASGGGQVTEDDSKKKLFGFGSKKKKKTTQTQNRIQYKPTSFLRTKKEKIRQPGNEAMDPDIQAAIALSMAEHSGIISNSSFPKSTANSNEYQGDLDEELAMAKALSLSENESSQRQQRQESKEDDLLGLESAVSPPQTYHKSVPGAASMPPPPPSPNSDIFSNIPPSPPPSPSPQTKNNNDDLLLGLKKPATVTTTNIQEAQKTQGADLLDADLLDSKPPATATIPPPPPQPPAPIVFDSPPPPNAKSWPPPPKNNHDTSPKNDHFLLHKLSPEQEQHQQGGRVSRFAGSMTRRLSSKKGLDDKAGLV